MLDKLMGHCEAIRAYEMGLSYGSMILRYERARERTHRRMMRMYYLNGDRTKALRQFKRCTDVLNNELGVRPSKRTVALYQELQTDRPRRPSDRPDGETGTSEDLLPPLYQALDHLGQLGETLNKVQDQIQQDIRVVKLLINRRQ
jgi:hypothetical protein